MIDSSEDYWKGADPAAVGVVQDHDAPGKVMTPFERKLRGELEALAAAGHSKASAAAEMGICTRTLQRWLSIVDPDQCIEWPARGASIGERRQQDHVRAGRIRVGRRRRSRPDGRPLTDTERELLERIMRMARAGCSKIEVADELGIHRATLDRWLAWMDPNRTLPWPRPGQSRGQRRHQQRIRLRVVAVGRRRKA